MIKQVIRFPEYLPAIQNVLPRNKNILVQTYALEKNLSEFYLFSDNKSSGKRLLLPRGSGAPLKMNPSVSIEYHNNIYYYLEEDLDTEQWILGTITLNE